jgi:DMSO/TMAO reductase YedYZ molybdopterin-dependent catalytic subunit
VPRKLRIDGLVAACLELRLAELELMPQHELRDDFRCREGWVVPDLRWRGVLLETVLARASPRREARDVQASAGNFSISIPLDRAASALLEISLNGTNLSVEHGAPVRLVLPGGECFTSVKNGWTIWKSEASRARTRLRQPRWLDCPPPVTQAVPAVKQFLQ